MGARGVKGCSEADASRALGTGWCANHCYSEAPIAGAPGRRGLPRSTNMDLRQLETARRIGTRHGMKWALVWVAVALIAAPAIGRYIEKHGK